MDILFRAIIVFAVTLIVHVAVFLTPKKRHPLGNEESVELRYPLGILILSIIGVAITSVAILAVVNAGSFREAVAPILVAIPFLLMALYILLALRLRIIIRPDGFNYYSPWKNDSFVSWSEVLTMRYSSINDWFIVDTSSNRFRISTHLVYFTAFLDGLMKNVEPSIWEKAINKFAGNKLAV